MSRQCITSATLMANAPAIEDAASRAGDYHWCSFGVHLCLTDFRPLCSHPGLAPLLNADGLFCNVIRSVEITKTIRDAVIAEWSAQIEKLRALGLKLSHIDSHQHVHTIPGLF